MKNKILIIILSSDVFVSSHAMEERALPDTWDEACDFFTLERKRKICPERLVEEMPEQIQVPGDSIFVFGEEENNAIVKMSELCALRLGNKAVRD